MPNYAISKVNPFIGSKNFQESKEFYQAIGWEIVLDLDDLAELKLGDSSFYLQRYYEKKWCENTMLHITVENANDWYEKIKEVLAGKSYGAAKVKPPAEQSYGGLVTFAWDPAGVLLHFDQPIEA